MFRVREIVNGNMRVLQVSLNKKKGYNFTPFSKKNLFHEITFICSIRKLFDIPGYCITMLNSQYILKVI